jgi:hypothetical protein
MPAATTQDVLDSCAYKNVVIAMSARGAGLNAGDYWMLRLREGMTNQVNRQPTSNAGLLRYRS